jgi:hypothetical protein
MMILNTTVFNIDTIEFETEEDEQFCRRYYVNRESKRQVYLDMGHTNAWADRRIVKYGIPKHSSDETYARYQQQLPTQKVLEFFRANNRDVKATARHYNVAPMTMHAFLIRENEPLRTHDEFVESRRQLSLIPKQEILEIFRKSGRNIAYTANYYEVANLTIRNFLLRENEPLRTRAEANKANEIQIPEQEVLTFFRNNKRNITKTAAQFGISNTVLYAFLRRINEPLRTLAEVAQDRCVELPIEEALVFFRDNNRRIVKLAERYNISRKAARNFLLRHNEPLNLIKDSHTTALHEQYPHIQNRNIWDNDELFIQTLQNDKEQTTWYWRQFFNVSQPALCRRLRNLNLWYLINYKRNHINEEWITFIKTYCNVNILWQGNIGEQCIFGDARPKWKVDLCIPEYKLAIDINPTITHSTQHTPKPHFKPKAVKYHQRRARLAEKNGWTLIQIFDWHDKDKILQIIRHHLKQDEHRYYARKCKLVEPTVGEARQFLNQYHLQGAGAIGKYRIGLTYNDELVGLITFSNPRFGLRKKVDYELYRMAFKGTVVGGASKLFKAFIKQYKPHSIGTYASLDIGHGKIYEILGFEYKGLAKLNALYCHYRSGEAYKVTAYSHKFQHEYKNNPQYVHIKKKKKAHANARKFYRINDAGNKIFVWRKS